MSAYAVKPGSTSHAAASHTRTDLAGTDHGQAGTPATHLRLTRRGRAVFTTLAAVPLVLGAIGIALNGGMAAAEGTAGIGAAAFDYVTIEAGQSLWQLAEAIAPSEDPRDVIADIVNLNQLASEAVQPGQRLALPADY